MYTQARLINKGLIMIDIKLLREHPELFRELVRIRNSDINVDELIAVDQQLREQQQKTEALQSELNNLSRQKKIEEAKQVKEQLAQQEPILKELQDKRKQILDRVPNFLAPDTPVGESDAQNLEVFRWGEQPKFDFTPKNHEELGKKLGILDIERGAKVSGAGFYYWVGDGARLQNAAFRYVEDLLSERGFISFKTPVLTKKTALYATGYFPFSQDETYCINDTDMVLIGTSEQSLVPYRMNETIEESKLPLLYTAFTPCFRYEAGAAGRATRGIFRVHQFHKQEQIVLCKPEESEYWNLVCQKNVEDIMQGLEIPYRVVLVCTGDMGAPGFKKYDTEGWFAGFGEYRETHSNSNLIDYKARRANIKFNGKNKGFVHTISSTALTDRALIAIIENNQTKEGYVKIPKALQKYMNGQTEIRPVQHKDVERIDVSYIKDRLNGLQYESIGDNNPETLAFFKKS